MGEGREGFGRGGRLTFCLRDNRESMKRDDATLARAMRRVLFFMVVAAGCNIPVYGAESPTVPFELPEIAVIATTPVGGTGITEDQYPGNVQIINHKDMPPNARSLPEVL